MIHRNIKNIKSNLLLFRGPGHSALSELVRQVTDSPVLLGMFSQDQVGEEYLGPYICISIYLDNIYLSTGEAGGGGHDGGQERPLQQPRVGGRVRGQHPLHRT